MLRAGNRCDPIGDPGRRPLGRDRLDFCFETTRRLPRRQLRVDDLRLRNDVRSNPEQERTKE